MCKSALDDLGRFNEDFSDLADFEMFTKAAVKNPGIYARKSP